MMDVQIKDAAALSSISRLALREYVVSHGWTDTGSWGDYAKVFALNKNGRAWEIWIPHRETASDYAANMARSIKILADIENRSQIDVFTDLVASGADVIRFSALDQEVDRTVSLHDCGHLQTAAYSVLAAAARAAEKPRPAYGGRPSDAVSRYLDSVSPDPLDARRFTLTLRSPVDGSSWQASMLPGEADLPFPRRASRSLVRGLGALETALAEARASDALEPFDEAVRDGVSANLCRAVAELTERSVAYGSGVNVLVDWALTDRPAVAERRVFKFSRHFIGDLEQAGAHLRTKTPDPDQHLIGEVVRLEREPEDFDGRAELLVGTGSAQFRVKVTFAAGDYDTVIQAHRDRLPIEVDGDLWHEAAGRRLENPSNVRKHRNGAS